MLYLIQPVYQRFCENDTVAKVAVGLELHVALVHRLVIHNLEEPQCYTNSAGL